MEIIMMCPYEILHFAPLALIVLSILPMKSSTNKSLTSFAVIILSLIGLLAGLHVHTGHEAAMHVGHFEEFTVLDPCYGYAASLLISTYIFVREAFKRLIQKDEA